MDSDQQRIIWLSTKIEGMSATLALKSNTVVILCHADLLSATSSVVRTSLSCEGGSRFTIDQDVSVPCLDFSAANISPLGLELCLKALYGDEKLGGIIAERPDLCDKCLEAADFLACEVARRQVQTILLARASAPPLTFVCPNPAPGPGGKAEDRAADSFVHGSTFVRVLQLIAVASKYGLTAFCDQMCDEIKKKVALGQVARLTEIELEALGKAAAEERGGGYLFPLVLFLMNQGTRRDGGTMGMAPLRLALTGP